MRLAQLPLHYPGLPTHLQQHAIAKKMRSLSTFHSNGKFGRCGKSHRIPSDSDYDSCSQKKGKFYLNNKRHCHSSLAAKLRRRMCAQELLFT